MTGYEAHTIFCACTLLLLAACQTQKKRWLSHKDLSGEWHITKDYPQCSRYNTMGGFRRFSFDAQQRLYPIHSVQTIFLSLLAQMAPGNSMTRSIRIIYLFVPANGADSVSVSIGNACYQRVIVAQHNL